MATNESIIAAALKSFGELAAEMTTSALRVLAFTAVNQAHEAVRVGDYQRAQHLAYALLQTLEALEKRAGGAG